MNTKYYIILTFYTFFFLFINQGGLIANVVINNGLTHIHVVDGNYIIKGKIEVQNTDSKPQAVKVYQKDYTFNHKGNVFYNEPGTAPRSNAKWIDFSPSYFELAPQEESVILYQSIDPEPITGQKNVNNTSLCSCFIQTWFNSFS